MKYTKKYYLTLTVKLIIENYEQHKVLDKNQMELLVKYEMEQALWKIGLLYL